MHHRAAAPAHASASWALRPPPPPGVQPPPSADAQEHAALDDPQEQASFTHDWSFEGRVLAESHLSVQGMYCAACAVTIEDVLGALPGVLEVRVQAAARRLRLRWDPSVTRLSELAHQVAQAGYRLLPAGRVTPQEVRLKERRQALWRLFVAGLCSMQIMMYTVPEYVADPGDIPADIVHLLHWASWVLSLPVVLFASGPFFQRAWRDARHGRIGMDTPVSIGIAVAFVASTAATFDPTGVLGETVWFDSLAMFVFFLLGGRYFEVKARDRSAGALELLIQRLPEMVERETGQGTLELVSVRRLQAGDVVRVHAGQAMPGDGELLSEAASVDEALLTGESHPLTRHQGEALVAGSFNLAGSVRVRLQRVGRDTRFAQIVSLMEQAAVERPRLAVLADRIAAPFLVLVLLAAGVAAAMWWPSDPQQAVSVALAVLVVTCPCALSLATPTAMLAGAGALARGGVLVRQLQALEALAGVDLVLLDKTGTLTHELPEVTAVHTRAGLGAAEATQLGARLARGSLHPVARAIVRHAAGASSDFRVSMLDAEVQEVAGRGLVGVLADGRHLRLGSARHCGLNEGQGGAASPSQGLRSHLCDDQGWLATFELQESLRSDAVEAVAALHAMGLQTRLLSGDEPAAVQRIAEAAGVPWVVAGASPERKLDEVKRLQGEGFGVAMVGDGLNDGPVLARADASFALGRAAPLAQAQADFVVQSARLQDVVRTVRVARATMRTVRQNLSWAALYNLLAVPTALAGAMPPWLAGLGMAASSLLVVGNAMRLGRDAPIAPAAPARSDSAFTPPPGR